MSRFPKIFGAILLVLGLLGVLTTHLAGSALIVSLGVRAIEAIQPPVVFLENVENLMEHDGGRTFQVIYTSLVEQGYILRYQPMATHEYANIPQTRRRIYIVAFRDHEMCQRFKFPEPVALTATLDQFLDRHEQQHEIYYYRAADEYEEYIRSNVTDPH